MQWAGPEVAELVELLASRLDAGPDRLRGTCRPLARACLDWTERRTGAHVAGVSGAVGKVTDPGWRRVGAAAVQIYADLIVEETPWSGEPPVCVRAGTLT